MDASKAPQLARVAEVAKYLTLSRSKIYQLMESGGLPYVKIGKSRRVRWTDVVAPRGREHGHAFLILACAVRDDGWQGRRASSPRP